MPNTPVPAAAEGLPESQGELPSAMVLVPTGRGSYRRYEDTTLDDILRSYDSAPAEFRDETREEVIAHWRLAEAKVNAFKQFRGVGVGHEEVAQ